MALSRCLCRRRLRSADRDDCPSNTWIERLLVPLQRKPLFVLALVCCEDVCSFEAVNILCAVASSISRERGFVPQPSRSVKRACFFFCMQPLLQNPACCCQGLNPRSYVLWRCWWFLTHELHSPLRIGEPLVPVNLGRGGRTEQCLPSCGRRVLKERFIRHTSADQNSFRYCHAN